MEQQVNPGILALDAGQTGTKVRLTGVAHSNELLLPGVRTHEPILPQLAALVTQVIEGSGALIGTASIGVSGITNAEHDAQALLKLIGDPSMERVLLTHDSVTSYLGALGERRGAVVASGTGVVTLGVGRSAVARIDGWGNIMGDAGSGYWIGREALDAVMRAHDGRGPRTTLTQVVQQTWPDLEEAYISLQSSPARVQTVAGFAKAVAQLADSDAVSNRICLAAAQELALSVKTALQRVGDPADPAERFNISVLGGVFGSPVIYKAFAGLIQQQCPAVELTAAAGSGLDGAAMLAGLPETHPLLGLVSSHEASLDAVPSRS